MTSFFFRAALRGSSSYALHAQQLMRDFESFGYEVRGMERDFDLPYIQKELALFCPNMTFRHDQRERVWMTMWETSRISQKAIHNLNTQASHVVVPCEWNASCFNALGVDKPIHIAPLGIDTSVFTPRPYRHDGLCVFGGGGRGERKRVFDLIPIFQRAFPHEKDVRLHLKLSHGEKVPKIDDPRVIFEQNWLSPEQMADWYADLTVFVSLSRGEGWGLMPHQAMGVGRAVLVPNFGGMREYFDSSVGYPLDFSLVQCGRATPSAYNDDAFSAAGLWAEVTNDSVVERMREVYNDQGNAYCIGERAAIRAKQFSWTNAHRKLEQILLKIGFFDKKVSTAPKISLVSRFEPTFSRIYSEKAWGRSGNSGPGSKLLACRHYLDYLKAVIATYNIKSVLDVGCGVWEHLSDINWSDMTYLGIDPTLYAVEQSRSKIDLPNVQFRQAVLHDIANISDYDLVLVKDVMQHLPNEDVQVMLDVLQSKARRALITNDVDPFDIIDCELGGYRPVDVEAPPFNLKCYERFKYSLPRHEKKVVLWLQDPAEGKPAVLTKQNS